MTVAPVCHIGDPLLINCTASVQFIKWNIFHVDGTLEKPVTSAQINSLDDNQMSQRTVNSTTFTFTRTSVQGVSPMISTLSIDSVDISLNGTVVRCSDVRNPMTSASITIKIIDTSQSE